MAHGWLAVCVWCAFRAQHHEQGEHASRCLTLDKHAAARAAAVVTHHVTSPSFPPHRCMLMLGEAIFSLVYEHGFVEECNSDSVGASGGGAHYRRTRSAQGTAGGTVWNSTSLAAAAAGCVYPDSEAYWRYYSIMIMGRWRDVAWRATRGSVCLDAPTPHADPHSVLCRALGGPSVGGAAHKLNVHACTHHGMRLPNAPRHPAHGSPAHTPEHQEHQHTNTPAHQRTSAHQRRLLRGQ